jgi:hypothetical protein
MRRFVLTLRNCCFWLRAQSRCSIASTIVSIEIDGEPVETGSRQKEDARLVARRRCNCEVPKTLAVLEWAVFCVFQFFNDFEARRP